MTQAILGQGTLIQYWDGAAYQTVAEAQSIGGPNLSGDDIDVTSHDSPGGFREYIQGLKEGGEVNFSGNLVPGDAGHQLMIEDQKSGERRNWRIVAPDAADIANRTTVTFIGYVRDCGFDFPTASQLTYSLVLKIAGEPTMSSVWSANLTALAVGAGALVPAFGGTTYQYALTVANATDDTTVTATCAAADRIYVNDTLVTSGVASAAISLDVGVNFITVRVEEDDKKPRLTSIIISRAAA